jgi:hypothetical protein
MKFIGFNIYCTDTEQRNLLFEGLTPWVTEARKQGLADFFTFRRFDARGPHVFALFRGKDELRDFLESRIQQFLGACGSSSMRPEEIRRRHRQCRGRTLCSVDREADFAENHSYVFFEQSTDDYLLNLGQWMADPEEFWRSLDALAWWSLDNSRRASSNSAAIRFISALHKSFVLHGVNSHEYWRFHAQKLLPVLQDTISTPEEMHYWLQLAVSEANRRVFSPVWDEQKLSSSSQLAQIDTLVSGIVDEKIGGPERKFELIYEVCDLGLHQLGQPVSSQNVIVLYALDRALQDTPVALTSS